MRSHNLSRAKNTKNKVPPILNQMVLGVAVIEPIVTVPQVWQIWNTHNTAGVSLLTWSFYLCGAAIWLFYGLKTHDKPIIVSSGLWVIMEGAVVAGLLIFS